MVRLAGSPFGVAANARWLFVAVGDGSIAVFHDRASLSPSLAFSLPVPGVPLGETITQGGRYLLAAAGSGAIVISVTRAEHHSSHSVLGTLTSPGGAGPATGGAIEVSASPDGRFAFVSLENSAEIAVFDLNRALTRGFGPSDFVGMIPVGEAPVGMAVSPGGRWLYATSEAERGVPPSGHALGVPGTLTVIDLRRAERDPAASVISTVAAGCGPVRVAASGGGRVVWVTARESDTVLGFSAARLRGDPGRSLIARVQVGEAPVGLALVSKGTQIVIADSNRFGAPGATSSLAVVSVPAALAGQPALLGFIDAGQFPREMVGEPGGQTLFVANYSSQQLEAVDVADLP
jgi:DNA-binding beta-propeller fold protein YncE